MSDRPPAFLFYPNDFSSDGKVEAMTTEQVGGYTLLLCKAWWEDPAGSLPNDDNILARWARLDGAKWAEVKSAVLAPFTLGQDGRWHQKRMRSEWEKLYAVRKRREKAAKIAASERWMNKGENANRKANACGTQSKRMQNACISSSSSSSLESTIVDSSFENKHKSDPYWDSLVVVFGKPDTEGSKKLYGKVRRSIKATGCDPTEIIIRANRLRAAWGESALTINSLETHWPKFAHDVKPLNGNNSRASPNRNQYEGLDEFNRKLDEKLYGPGKKQDGKTIDIDLEVPDERVS